MPGYLLTVLATAALVAVSLFVTSALWASTRRSVGASILAGAAVAAVAASAVASAHAAQADLGPEVARVQLLVALGALIVSALLATLPDRAPRLDASGRPVLHPAPPGRLDQLGGLALGFAVSLPIVWPAASVLSQEAYLGSTPIPWYYGAAASLAVLAVAALPWTRSAARRSAGYVSLTGCLALWGGLIVLANPVLSSRLDAVVARIGHDTVHVLIVLLAFPDHPYLETVVWNLIGLAFRKETSLVVSTVLFASLASAAAIGLLARPMPTLASVQGRAERRRRRALVRRFRRFRSLPSISAAVALVLASGIAFASGAATYDPTPKPLAALGGAFRIPIVDVGGTRFVKYAVTVDKVSFRIDAVKRPDGEYVVTLDACLVCAPQGYAQLGSDLFCKFCGTPIPIMTVGRPGGCNPVPLKFEKRADALVVDANEAVRVWTQTTRGK